MTSNSRALVLTDVVDSTLLNQTLGDTAAAAVWLAHDRVARDLLLPWHGREIDKTDGMLLMFDRVDHAVQYALAYQQALAQLAVPLLARAGLHWGAVLLRENSADDVAAGAKPLELDGLAKPIAARVMAMAVGGQLLLSEQAYQALVYTAPGLPAKSAWQARSHGHWLLKGVAAPTEIFELSLAPSTLPGPSDSDKAQQVERRGDSWLPRREIANNLPHQTTAFVGREAERQHVAALLAQARLVTLVGMGGVGKTRLTLQVTAEIQHRFVDGVWFINLSPLSDAGLVLDELAQTLGLRDEPQRPLLQTLCAYLKTRRVLLILDNCEHLLKAAAELAHAVLQAAPLVVFLANSREALRVPGEQVVPVLPLPLPARDASLQSLLQSTAVRLFMDRAQSHTPGFVLGPTEAPAVAELVSRLEGIPLALELAAARLRSLSLADINLRLRDRYKLLTGGAQVLQQRQQTLRALVDWSYEMLRPDEQVCLQRLAVFAGGFDLAAAEAVCGAEPVGSDDVLDLLGSLVEKSLVLMEVREGLSRYRMLETLREYAHEKLRHSVDDQATAARHADYFFAFAKTAKRGLMGAEQALWIARLETELDNLRAAMALALGGGTDPFIAVKMAVNLQGFWILRGYVKEGRALVQAALNLPSIQASEMAQAHALYVGAALAGQQSDHAQARQMLLRCLALRRSLGNPVEIAATLSTLCLAKLQGGDIDGASACECEALALFQAQGDRVGEALGYQHLGQCAMARGDTVQARTHLQQALLIAQQIEHHEIEAECELMLGALDFEQPDLAAAHQRFERSMAICQSAGDKVGQVNALRWLGKLDLAHGQLEAAQPRLMQALQAFMAMEMHDELLATFEDQAQLWRLLGQDLLAAQLAASVDEWRTRLALQRQPPAQRHWQAWLVALRSDISSADFDAAWHHGQQWAMDEALRRILNSPTAAAAGPA